MEYTVEEVRLRDDLVKVRIGDKDSVTDFVLYATDYFSLSLSEGQSLSDGEYETLRKMHGYCFAYRKCLRKLAHRDHSVAEIRDVLKETDNLDHSQQEEILQRLIDSRLLDDERLTASVFEYDQARLVGHRKTVHELRNRGVDRNLIEEYDQKVVSSQETDRCRQKAEMLLRGIRNRSHRETVAMLKQRLIQDGYDSAVADEAISRLHLEKDSSQEREKLQAVLEKGLVRYANKYRGYELRSRLYALAMRKGYTGEDISAVLNELEVSEDEN